MATPNVPAATLHFIGGYKAKRSPTTFLTGLLSFNANLNVHDSEYVTIDLERFDENISIVQTDQSTGYRDITADVFTNKSFKPPVYADSFSMNGFDLRQRMAGQNPFDDVNVAAQAAKRASKGVASISDGIQRAVELQASQVLQTGVLTLKDQNGSVVYTLDYGAKATHFPTVGTSWSNPAADIKGDLKALATTIRNDGLAKPDNLLFGSDALSNFLENTAIKEDLNFRRAELIEISPKTMGNGATFVGTFKVGDLNFKLWSYDGRYKDPETETTVTYIDDDNVVMFASGDADDSTVRTQIELTYGGYKPLRPPTADVRKFMPGRLIRHSMVVDTNGWYTPDGMRLTVGAGIRPLVIPTGIDTWGCLDTSA